MEPIRTTSVSHPDWDDDDHPLTSPFELLSPSPPKVAELGDPTGKSPSEGYYEVELLRERAYAIELEPVVSAPLETQVTPSAAQWSLIQALYELRLLSLGQIHREFLPSIGERQLRRELLRLRTAGFVRRGWLYGGKGTGRGKPVYVLAQRGFALLCDTPDHHASGQWHEPKLHSPQHALHDLIRNEWLFAFRSLAPRQLIGFRGTRSSRLEVPWVREPRTAPRRLSWIDLGARGPVGLLSREFSNIIPDLTLELGLEGSDGQRIRTDLLVEIERGNNNNETVRSKALAYDGLLNGWWEEHPRYKTRDRPPSVCFAVPDVQRARRLIVLLDAALQGHVVIPPHTQTRAENEQGIVSRAKRLYLGRQNVFVVVTHDVHQRTLRAWRVPEEPPGQRAGGAGEEAERLEAARAVPRRARLLIGASELVDPAG